MGFFNSGGATGTIGAGKSGATTGSRFGPDSAFFWVAVVLTIGVVCPPMVGAFLVVMVISQVRRVRPSRLWALAGVSWAIAVLIAWGVAGHPLAVVGWMAEAFRETWGAIGVTWFDAQGDIGMVASTLAAAMATLWWLMAAFGIPAGITWGALYAGFMRVRRLALADLEDPKYAWDRPVGWLDVLRTRRARKRMADGAYTVAPDLDAEGFEDTTEQGRVGLGTGAYGEPIQVVSSSMLRPTLVLGGPSTGKTACATSLTMQHVMNGAGLGIIDYKGDQYLPVLCAAIAAAQGRRFLHFTLADKNGKPYMRPHPEAPNKPAFYDPLVRGNATSKTDMLLNSVNREGDAAAYFRSAQELTQIAYQVASITGYDHRVVPVADAVDPDAVAAVDEVDEVPADEGVGVLEGQVVREPKPGLEVARDLLDMDRLRKHVDQWRDHDGRAWARLHPDEPVKVGKTLQALYPDLVQRITDVVDGIKKDPIIKGGINDTISVISTYLNGAALDRRLRPGPPEETIDLVRAAMDGDIVLFTLSVQDYGETAKNVGTLVLLDLQNAANELRDQQTRMQREHGESARVLKHPFYFQIEEFSGASSDAVLDVLNKVRDVNIRPVLSTQSWSDIVAVDDSGVFAKQVVDQCGNFFIFGVNDSETADLLAGLSGKVTKKYPREKKEFRAGLFGFGLKSANLGEITGTPVEESPVTGAALQGLDPHHCIWISKSPLSATHTFDAGPNHWWEIIHTVLVPPTVHAKNNVADLLPDTHDGYDAVVGDGEDASADSDAAGDKPASEDEVEPDDVDAVETAAATTSPAARKPAKASGLLAGIEDAWTTPATAQPAPTVGDEPHEVVAEPSPAPEERPGPVDDSGEPQPPAVEVEATSSGSTLTPRTRRPRAPQRRP